MESPEDKTDSTLVSAIAAALVVPTVRGLVPAFLARVYDQSP